MIDAKLIQKYAKYSTSELRKKACEKFKKRIRQRDAGQPCISCGKYEKLQAGHFYSAGHHPVLEMHPDNVHGQCLRCNYYLSGNGNEYRKNLIKKIGIERVEALDLIVAQTKHTGYKHDRINLIEKLEQYK